MEVTEKQTAEFSFKVNKDKLVARWFLGEEEVTKNEKFIKTTEGRIHKLKIKDCQMKDAGPVKAVVENVETTANLKVKGKSRVSYTDKQDKKAISGPLVLLKFQKYSP